MSNTVSKFVSLVLAQLQGDTDTVIAIKNEKKAKSAINGQINALEREVADQKDVIEELQGKFNAVFAPTSLITASSQTYVNALAAAQNNLTAAQEKLEGLEKDLKFFSGLLREFTDTVVVEDKKA